MSDDAAGTEAGVAFSCRGIPNSYFWEIAIRLGDQLAEIGGSRAFASPEDALMNAALALIGGADEAEAPFPAENDNHIMTLRIFDPQDGVVRKDRLQYPCELIWSQVDPHPHVVETEHLGIAPSTRGLVEAILKFGRDHNAGRKPSAALVALTAALESR